jgi:hypothetical protein
MEIMRKLMLCAMLSLSFQLAQGQVIDTLNAETKKEMYDFYMTKSKKQNKTGLILLGSGIVAIGTGFILGNNSDSFFDSEATSGALLILAGGLATLSSIPVLAVAGSNKNKAETYVQIGTQRPMNLAAPNSNVVSVGLKLEF